MFRTDVATASATLPTPSAAGTEGFFTNGNPGTGTPATVVDADFLNMVQEELRAIVVAGGLTPSKTTLTQVRDALALLYLAKAGGTLTGALGLTAGSASAPGAFFSGDTNTGIFSPAADQISKTTNGVERQRVNGTGEFSRVIPGGSVLYPDFACRAWGNFQGNGTKTGGGNSTVTRTGVGVYAIGFTTAMPDTAYAIVSCSEDSDQSGNAASTTPFAGSRTTTGFTLYGVNEGSASSAQDNISNFAVFR
jgi:hypothetical protein